MIQTITSFCANGGHPCGINGSKAFPKGLGEGSGAQVGQCPGIGILSPKDLEHQDGGTVHVDGEAGSCG